MIYFKIRILHSFILFFQILIICSSNTYGQKKIIDSGACAQWQKLGTGEISSDGRYVTYYIEYDHLGYHSLVVKDVEQNLEQKFTNIKGFARMISGGMDHYVLFQNQHDSLLVLTLRKKQIRYIPDVSSVSFPANEKSDWISYQLKGPDRLLVCLDLFTGNEQRFQNAAGHLFSRDGKSLVLQTENDKADKPLQRLSLINLKTGSSSPIWEGEKADNLVLDNAGEQLAFRSGRSVWYCPLRSGKAICLYDQASGKLDSGLVMESIQRFSYDGKRLFVSLRGIDKKVPDKGGVEVWSYTDKKIQPLQLLDLSGRNYEAVIQLSDARITRLEQNNEFIAGFNNESKADNVVFPTYFEPGVEFWNNANKYTRFIMSTLDGRKMPFPYDVFGLSPGGKYAIVKDRNKEDIFSYEIATGAMRNISAGIGDSLQDPDWLGSRGLGGVIAGWIGNEEAVLINDKHDIWLMELSKQGKPVNITKGFGRAHNIAFTLVSGGTLVQSLERKELFYLSAFNPDTKECGFFRTKLDKKSVLEKLSMGPYNYSISGSPYSYGSITPVIYKAKDAGVYVLARQSATEAPNFFVTRDFRNFTPVSDVHPEKEYNWYTTELHIWTSLDGRKLQGVLYKPENFDPKKKYPVLIHYYEEKSDALNAYITPDLYEGANIDIPTFVSNGYLVFTPDIYYTMGDAMQGTYDAVISGANYLSELPFVDKKKMGIQGHSFGGYETNYLVTHSNLFAAACSASGIIDLISGYGFMGDNGSRNQAFGENGQNRLGASFWEAPHIYIKNSPVFALGNVTTPLLMMHTKDDGACSYTGAMEMFIGLRRLGKKAWMLVYEGDHSINGKDGLDFNVRMMQFFDHYLKDKPAPVWMTRGIPAEKKGLDNGFDYDTKIKTPGAGLLTIEEQKKADSIMVRKPIVIELK